MRRIWLPIALAGAVAVGYPFGSALAGEHGKSHRPDSGKSGKAPAEAPAEAPGQQADLEALASKATVTAQHAINVAKTKVAGRLAKVELQSSKGKPVYEVKFAGGEKVLVDASSGAVVDVRKPRRDKDEDEDDD